ncbi:MAG: phage portal protein [Gammaproteobacteria bacterium]|nr:phage portal protein [Gammaproteobacteria bacterium]
MSYYSRVISWLASAATKQGKGGQDTSPLSSAHEDAPSVGIDSALQVSTVWSCVVLIVENISSLPLDVYKTDSNNQRTVDKQTRLHQVLHESPNKRQTSMEFWLQMLLNFVLRGNAYARIVRDRNGEVVALWPLAADQVEVIVADDGNLVYVYRFENEGLIYNENDIFHIRGIGNGVVGMSPLEYMRSSVGLAISAQNHTSRTYRKNARRPGVMMTDSVLTPEQRKAVKKNFGDIVTGSGSELHVLEAQFKFEPLGMSPADIQLLESRKFAVQDLARWFGVPSVLINDTGETTSLGSSVGQIVDGFFKLKLRPMLVLMEQAIRKRVLTPKQRGQGYIAEFNFDALLRASLKDRIEIYAKAVQNGLKTRNECRKRENDPAIDGGDELTVQSNLIPLNKLGEMGGSGTVPEEPIQQ